MAHAGNLTKAANRVIAPCSKRTTTTTIHNGTADGRHGSFGGSNPVGPVSVTALQIADTAHDWHLWRFPTPPRHRRGCYAYPEAVILPVVVTRRLSNLSDSAAA